VCSSDLTKQIDFVLPVKYIRKFYNGVLYSVKGKQTDMVCTPKHQQPIFINSGKTKMKLGIEDWKVSAIHYIPIAGEGKNRKELTPLERFLIAASADGSFIKRKKQIIQLSFSKQRKIDRFLSIIRKTRIPFSEVKGKARKGNIKATRRFLVFPATPFVKGLKNIKPLNEIGKIWAQEFIKELLNWDGSTKTVLYWSGTNSEDADYIQAVCALGGITCNRNIQIDKCKASYKPVHRLVFIMSDKRKCGRIKKQEHKNTYGYVVCVRVPKGNIIIRRNNKVNITGNCHHLSGKDVQYVEILKRLLAPVRIGLTATYPTTDAAKFMLEGLFGKIIGEIDLNESIEKGTLAKPDIKLIATDCSNDLSDLTRYSDIYDAVIINSKSRNQAIIDEIKYQNNLDKSTLTYVSQIEHGNNICIIAAKQNVPITFIQGKTDGESRELFRQLLQQKKIMNVIATTVWCEGVNVKSINCIILAGGGKSELRLLQTLGRGLRKDIGKDDVIIVDFIDKAKHISEHCCSRLQVYINNGWL
jgi:hypothetical protein